MAVPLHYRDLPAPVFNDEGVWTGDFDSSNHLIINLGGTTDGYNVLTRELHDYKTLADSKVSRFLKGQDGGRWSPTIKDAWVWQVNIYRWLVMHTPTEQLRPWFEANNIATPSTAFLPAPERLQMQLISMMEIPLTSTRYVPMRTTEAYEVGEVPILPDEEVEAFIRERALEWFRWLVLKVRPPVVEEEDKWLCKNCQFNGELLQGPCFPDNERRALEDIATEDAAEPTTPLLVVEGYE
jgi:hypothetical protein